MRLLQELSQDHSWYEETARGVVKISGGIGESIKKAAKHDIVSAHARIALALTQSCCEQGNGIVYAVFREPRKPPRKSTESDEFDCFSMQMSVPGLLFVPRHWTTERRAQWKAMTAIQQLEYCWAPVGWVHPGMTVLPFAAVVHPNDKSKLKTASYHGRLDSPVLAFFTGSSIYMGPTQDMQSRFQLYETFDDEGKLFKSDRIAAKKGWSSLRQWKCLGMKGAIESLEQLSRRRPELLTCYGLLMRRVQEMRRAALPLEEGISARVSKNKAVKAGERQELRARNARLWEDVVLSVTVP